MISALSVSSPRTCTSTPEHEFLLNAARVDASGHRDLRELAQDRLDWTSLIPLASIHGLLPLLARTVHQTCADLVPAEICQSLRDDLQRNAHRNLALASELIRLSAALRAAGVVAIAYKGPALAVAAYGDIGLRYFRDLDLVVRPADVDRSRRILGAFGYTESRCPEQTSALLRLWSGGQLPFYRGDEIVELHWQIAPRCISFDLDGAWARARRAQIGGGEITTFALEDVLLILCVHGAKHLWERLAWIRDVAGLIARQEIDWPELFARAISAGARRMLVMGLLLADDLFGAPLPAAVADSCRADSSACALAAGVRRRLTDRLPGSYGAWETAGFHLRVRERVSDRLRYGIRLATTPTPTDWELLRLPPRLTPLYSVFRPLRLGLNALKRHAGFLPH